MSVIKQLKEEIELLKKQMKELQDKVYNKKPTP